MIPIYIFYSMFGFQRTGDAFWAAGDQMVRGFVLGATAGRTTLNGEGLQHEDGHSPLLASTNPACVSYDPAFGFEVAHIVKDALRRMYGDKPEEIFYYLTVYNEPYAQPAEPEDADVEGILRGIHRYSPAAEGDGPKAQLLASGVSVQWALEAQRLLQTDWNVQADVWSVTSWNELRRDGLATDEHNFMNPDGELRVPYVTKALDGAAGPVRRGVGLHAGRAGPDRTVGARASSRRWAPTASACRTPAARCGGTSRSTPPRSSSKVLGELAKRGEVKPEAMREAIDRYRLGDVNAAPTAEAEGGAE